MILMESAIVNITGKDSGKLRDLSNSQSECRDILESYNIVDYKEVGQYLEIGEIPQVDGWILHISVIRIEFTPLLHKVLPTILKSKVPFKIPKDKTAVRTMLDAGVGVMSLGKIICIYSLDEDELVNLAKSLVGLTTSFRGPAVPTDRFLGGCVYTQYNHFILSENTTAINDSRFSKSKKWPFQELAPATPPASNLLWNNKYKPLKVIKPDLKGRVIQGNYFKSLFSIKPCIIKEGIKNMWADEFGRDITDRLRWQHELYKDLKGKLPMPEIFDFFEENGNTYLAMEFIKGDALINRIDSIYSGCSWFSLSNDHKIELIQHCLDIVNLIEKLHAIGYIHRDVTPANFILDKKGKAYLIDMELAYSIRHNNPNPPFKLGTPGYISQEQRLRQTPTIKEDVYAFGAFMILSFTGMSPLKFNTNIQETTIQNLSYFTQDPSLIYLIHKCLNINPESRPTLATIATTIKSYQENLRTFTLSQKQKIHYDSPDRKKLSSTITTAMAGLVSSLALSTEGIWLSRKQQAGIVGVQSDVRAPQPGFYRGIAGILFLVARGTQIGYGSPFLHGTYARNYNYLRSQCVESINKIEPGFFYGHAGIAIAIHEGIKYDLLLEDSEDSLLFLRSCFATAPRSDYSLASGLSGWGLALLRCCDSLEPIFYKTEIERTVNELLSAQQKDGSWRMAWNSNEKSDKMFGLANGTAGVIYFLLCYAEKYGHVCVLGSLRRGLTWLFKRSKNTRTGYSWTLSTQSRTTDNLGCIHGIPGLALIFIKAYEIFKDPLYKQIAEATLFQLPKQPIYNDFTQAHGLSGLGEIYLEANKVLRSSEWQERANWIAGVFMHTMISEDNVQGYWSVNEFADFEGDLMIGVSGILHFLMRFEYPNTIRHIWTN
jgi:serine/threonine protein kinase